MGLMELFHHSLATYRMGEEKTASVGIVTGTDGDVSKEGDNSGFNRILEQDARVKMVLTKLSC